MPFSTLHHVTSDDDLTATTTTPSADLELKPTGPNRSIYPIITDIANNDRPPRFPAIATLDVEDELPSIPSVPAKAYTSEERLCYAPIPDLSAMSFSTLPSRSPVRPTTTQIGGAVRHSSTSSSSGLDEKLPHTTATVTDDHDDTRLSFLKDWTFYSCFASFGLLSFATGMAMTSCSSVLPIIAQSLHLSAVQAFWIPTSFLLCSSLVQPLAMRLSHATGCKPLLLLGVMLFTIGSLGAALSYNTTTIILSRCIEGAGSGIISVLTQLSLSQLVPNELTPDLEHIVSWLEHLGAGLGLLIGGVATDIIGWRSIYFTQVNFGGVGFLSLALLLRLPYSGAKPMFTWLFKIDYLGWLLLCTSVVSTTIALSWAPDTWAWTSWQSLVPLSLGFAGLAGLVVYTRLTHDPILPWSLLMRDPAALALLIQAALFTTLLYATPFLLHGTLRLSTSMTALAMAPAALAFAASYAGAMSLLPRDPPRLIAPTALIITVIALACISTVLPSAIPHTLGAGTPVTLAGLVGLALGVLAAVARQRVLTSAATDDEAIHAGCMVGFVGGVGRLVGAVAAGLGMRTGFGGVVDGIVGVEIVVKAEWTRNLVGLAEGIVGTEVAGAYAVAVRNVWIGMAFVAGVGMVVIVMGGLWERRAKRHGKKDFV